MDRLRFYERCGARQFQKMVFIVEKIKYRLLRPFIKLAIRINDKTIDKKIKKTLKPSYRSKIQSYFNQKIRENPKLEKITKPLKKINRSKKWTENIREEERTKWIISYYQKEKLKFRREIAQEKNRNYHLDMNHVNQTLYYLHMNKQIHQQDIILNVMKSGIAFLLLHTVAIIPSIMIYLYLLLQGISAFINFECINLQNYNILRIELKREQLEKIQLQKNKKKIQRYGEVSTVISPLFEQEKLPSKEEIVSSITTLEQLKQMRDMITTILPEKEKIYTKRGE